MWPFKRETEIPTFGSRGTPDNTIAAGSAVRGDVNGPGGFRVDGRVEGSVDADGPVVIGEGGVVEGGVRGRDVIVLGSVRGDVRAAGHLEIGPKGRIVGDITTGSFRMHKGGVFRGTSRMADDSAPASMEIPKLEAPRVRTLPPPAGAVPPPAEVIAEASEERLRASGEN